MQTWKRRARSALTNGSVDLMGGTAEGGGKPFNRESPCVTTGRAKVKAHTALRANDAIG